MSDSLGASIEKLKQSTARLNKLTDDANKVVLATETFLNQECAVGIETYVTIVTRPSEDGVEEECVILGYERWQTKFRITVHVGENPENGRTKPWSEWDRTIKMIAITGLPTLLEKIAKIVNDHVIAAQKATSAVDEILRVLDHKGTK